MNYLVTGGCGFIGSHIIRQLKRQGHNPIAYDLYPNKTSIEQVLSPEEIKEVKIIQGGVDDKDVLIRILKENRIDGIIHLAALLGAAGENDRAEAVRVNILGTINIFEAALAAGIKRVVWASSSSVYASEDMYRNLYGEKPVPNDALLKPATVYGATKAFCECMGELYYNRFGLEAIGLRYGMVFGIARMRGLAQYVTNLINNPAEGLPGEVDAGDTAPCWLYVEDAARATVIASQCTNPKSRNFFIGGDITPISEVRDYVLTLLPDAQIKLKPGKVFGSAYNLDKSAAEKELGFKCEYSVFEGVRETINLIRKKKNLPPV